MSRRIAPRPSRRRDTQSLHIEARNIQTPRPVNTGEKQARLEPLKLPERIAIKPRPSVGDSFTVDRIVFACIGQRRVKAGRNGLQSLWVGDRNRLPISLALPLHGGQFTASELKAMIDTQNAAPSTYHPIAMLRVQTPYAPPKSVTYTACPAPIRIEPMA